MTIELHTWNTPNGRKISVALEEMGLPYKVIPVNITKGEQMAPGFLKLSPNNKIPAIVDSEGPDGKPFSLFESAAICNWLADSHPQAGLIAPSGTWARALHDQWTAFTLAEVEANLGHTARNQFIYTENERIPAVYEQNAREAKRGLAVLHDALKGKSWLVEDRFSVTDIFVGYAVVWAHVQGMTADLSNVAAYAERILARPLCPYGALG